MRIDRASSVKIPSCNMQDNPKTANFKWMISLALIVVAGVGVRIIWIGRQSFDAAEIATLLGSAGSLVKVFFPPWLDCYASPLYDLLLRFWMTMKFQEAFARVLSVMFSGFSIGLVFLLAKRLMGYAQAVYAAVLFAIYPLSVVHAQQVGWPSLLTFLSLWSFLGYLQIREQKNPLWLTLPLVLGLITRPAFLVLLIVLVLWFLLDMRRAKITFQEFFLPLFAAIACWFVWLAGQLHQQGAALFPTVSSLPFGQRLSDLGALAFFGCGADPASALVVFQVQIFHGTLIILGILLVAYAASCFKEEAFFPLLTWLVMPLALGLVFFDFSADLVAMTYPAICLLLAALLGRLGAVGHVYGVLLLAIVLAIQAVSLTFLFTDSRFANEDWRGLAAYISANEQKHDALIVPEGLLKDALGYYYTGQLAAWFPPARDDSIDQIKWEAQVVEFLQKHRRVFLVADGSDAGQSVDSLLFKRGFEDRHPDLAEQYRIPLIIAFTSRKNAFRALHKGYDPFIDLSKGNFHESQLDVRPLVFDGPWLWIGKGARFYLKRTGTETTARVRTRVDLDLHKGESLSFYLLVDGTPIKMFLMSKTGEHEFSTELPQVQGELIEIGFYTTKVFSATTEGPTPETVERSFQIGYVGVE